MEPLQQGLGLLKYLGYNLSAQEETVFRQIWNISYQTGCSIPQLTKEIFSEDIISIIGQNPERDMNIAKMRELDFKERIDKCEVYEQLKYKPLNEIVEQTPHVFLVAKKDSEEIRQRMLEQILI